MKGKLLFITSLLFAATLGAQLPQWIIGNVEGSTAQVTYQYEGLGMNTNGGREKVKEILDHVVGIEDFKIDPKLDKVTITFDQETTKAEWIAKSLEALGFTPDHYGKTKTDK